MRFSVQSRQEGAGTVSELIDIDTFVARARDWLEANAKPVESPAARGARWGAGRDDVPVFYDLEDDEEAALLQAIMAWQRQKFDAGYGALTWPTAFGGAGLTADYALAFGAEEARFETPGRHETFSVTLNLVAPTIRRFGTDEQRRELIPRFLRTTELCCQLFSEPGAGSDLAGLSTHAVRDGSEWVINGQKIWSSGARFAAWGELICRTDSDVPKHAGQTAFIIPMDVPGITVVPIRQMTGGASFNEVFFDDVRVPDSMRLGDVGQGWTVALTTLGYERTSSGSKGSHDVGGSWQQVLALARWLDATDDPVTRQQLAELYTLKRVRELLTARSLAARRAGSEPGPEGSIGKLIWTQWLARVGEVVAGLLGPRLTADTGEWGTFAWTKHVLGAPGYRIAGGSDEIQRNIIGERVLGLPGEPRVDRDVAFRDIPR
jgi:alkylation response protein AidB-like acyl-CoA dehydrogenase